MIAKNRKLIIYILYLQKKLYIKQKTTINYLHILPTKKKQINIEK